MKKPITRRMEAAAEQVLRYIPSKKNLRVSTRSLCYSTNLSPREMKECIAILRIDHPIVSTLGSGGGYWMAQTAEDMDAYLNMMKSRRDTYDHTIQIMEAHRTNLIDVSQE